MKTIDQLQDAWAAIAEAAAALSAKDLREAVVALVGHDGTGDTRTIVDQAIRDWITDAEEIAEIVREARRDATIEMTREEA